MAGRGLDAAATPELIDECGPAPSPAAGPPALIGAAWSPRLCANWAGHAIGPAQLFLALRGAASPLEHATGRAAPHFQPWRTAVFCCAPQARRECRAFPRLRSYSGVGRTPASGKVARCAAALWVWGARERPQPHRGLQVRMRRDTLETRSPQRRYQSLAGTARRNGALWDERPTATGQGGGRKAQGDGRCGGGCG